MDRVIVIEVRDRRMHLRTRQRLIRFPVSIGRAYDNDIIVDDRYVDAHHARLSLDDDGVVVLEDLGSVNGLRDGQQGSRQSRLRLPSGGMARMGETVLRVMDEGHTVARAVPLADESRVARMLRRPGLAWLAIAGSLVAQLGITWSTRFGSDGGTTALGGASTLFVMLAVWAGIWSFAGRGAGMRGQFRTHLAIAALALLALTLWVGGVQYAEFLWPELRIWAVVRAVGYAAIIAIMLAAQLSLVTVYTRRRRLLAAAGAAVLLVGLVKLGEWGEADDFDSAVHYSDVLRPFGTTMAHTVSMDQLFEDARGLRDALDAGAGREAGANSTAAAPAGFRSETPR
jgi:hypothetical protein